MPDDEALWSKLSRRDAEAFEDFYRQHYVRLRSFVKVCVGSPQAADDVAQETFLQLWKHPNGFNPSRGTLKAYVFGIARRVGCRTRAGRVPLCSWMMRSAGSIPRRGACSGCAKWKATLTKNSPEIFEIPLGTVQSRLYAARRHLRRMWKSGK